MSKLSIQRKSQSFYVFLVLLTKFLCRVPFDVVGLLQQHDHDGREWFSLDGGQQTAPVQLAEDSKQEADPEKLASGEEAGKAGHLLNLQSRY